MTLVDDRLVEATQRLVSAMPPTPVLDIAHPHFMGHVKLEYANAHGSMKDRSAAWILKGAAERGELRASSTVVESSSGNFATSLAAMCRMVGVPFVPVVDANCTPATITMLRSLCPGLEVVTQRDESGGYLANRLRRVRELCAEPHVFRPDQYTNRDAMWGHYYLTGNELAHQVARLDLVFVGTGTCGTIAGISRRVKEKHPMAKVVAVDVEGSVLFGGAPRTRHIPGLGSSMKSELLSEAEIDDVVVVSERESALACQRLLSTFGIFAGGSTGSVFAAAERYVGTSYLIKPQVAFIAADRGTAYAATVYNPAWVEEFLPASAAFDPYSSSLSFL